MRADADRVKTRWTRILLVLVFGVVALAIGYSRYAGPHYAPAESLAGPMTNEWRDFADEVDHICARNFNAMQAELADAASAPEGWQIQYVHQSETYRDVLALGEPPARPQLFHRWLANVGRRAQMMEAIGDALARGDRTEAGVTEERLAAMKIQANWLGQHFGLRICTSNGPGREPGDSGEPYLKRVDDACLWRNKREDIYASRHQLVPDRILTLSRSETVLIATIPPPADKWGLRRRILKLKKGLDRYGTGLFAEAQRHRPKFKQFWGEVAAPRLADRSDRVQIELQKLGLPDCGNWGPTPASTLLPRG